MSVDGAVYHVLRTGTLITGDPEWGVALRIPGEVKLRWFEGRFVSTKAAMEFGQEWADEVNGKTEKAMRRMNSCVRVRRVAAI